MPGEERSRSVLAGAGALEPKNTAGAGVGEWKVGSVFKPKNAEVLALPHCLIKYVCVRPVNLCFQQVPHGLKSSHASDHGTTLKALLI